MQMDAKDPISQHAECIMFAKREGGGGAGSDAKPEARPCDF